MLVLASLNGTDLPEQFSYRPYVPSKRNSITPTANAVVVQSSSPSQIVHEEGIISWRIEGGTPAEFQVLYDLYNTSDIELYTFTRYWGEVLEVYFNALDEPSVRGRTFSMSGQFQVICVTTDYSAGCNP